MANFFLDEFFRQCGKSDMGSPVKYKLYSIGADFLKPLDIKTPNGHITKDGRKARYLATVKAGNGVSKLVFAIDDGNGYETVQRVGLNGRIRDDATQPNDIYDAAPPLKVDDFCMVLGDNSNYTKFRHKTHEEAVKEALRLSSQIAGVNFNVLACMGAARDGKWEDSNFGGIPF